MLYYRIEKRRTFASDAISNLEEEEKKGKWKSSHESHFVSVRICFCAFTFRLHSIFRLL